MPDLCLGAGGKAPGFVQQMLFSAPVQEKDPQGTNIDVGRGETNLAIEQINQSVQALWGQNPAPNANASPVQNSLPLSHGSYKFSH